MLQTRGSRGLVSSLDPLSAAGNTVISLSGEHDAFTADALWEAMARTMALGDADLVVDLRNVEFMGAATVGVIVRTGELLRLQSRSMVLRSPSACAERILGLCGLTHLVEQTPAAGGGP